jgi:hypothetical protein
VLDRAEALVRLDDRGLVETLDRHGGPDDVKSVEGGHVGDRRLAPSIGEQPVGDLEPMARDPNVADGVVPRSSHRVWAGGTVGYLYSHGAPALGRPAQIFRLGSLSLNCYVPVAVMNTQFDEADPERQRTRITAGPTFTGPMKTCIVQL